MPNMKNAKKKVIVDAKKKAGNNDFKASMRTAMKNVEKAILNKDVDDRLVVFKTLFILSQINSPRILPAFSLRLLNQKDFTEKDIEIIKENVKFYVNSLVKEVCVA